MPIKIFSEHSPEKLEALVNPYLLLNAEKVTWIAYQTEMVQNTVHYSVAITTNITPLRAPPVIIPPSAP